MELEILTPSSSCDIIAVINLWTQNSDSENEFKAININKCDHCALMNKKLLNCKDKATAVAETESINLKS